MEKIKVKDFSLSHSLECGQVFRWNKLNGGQNSNIYKGLIENTPVKIWQEGNKLAGKSYRNKIDEKKLGNYFRLDENLEKILEKINVDTKISKAIAAYKGLRVIRQEPWECLLSYLCSPRTKIAHINKSLELIAENFGEKVEFDGEVFWRWPEAGKISSVVPKLMKQKCNLRTFKLANYIIHTAKKIEEEKFDLCGLESLNYQEAHKELQTFLGVGPKVADCVCLFSLNKDEAFPIDVWIKKMMEEFYLKNKFGKTFVGKNLTEKKYKELGEFARKKFGSYAGHAQEYLYYYYRMK